jgi:hypothetical protein
VERFNFFAGLEGEGDVAAVVEGFFESGLEIVVGDELGNPAFESFVLGAGGEF